MAVDPAWLGVLTLGVALGIFVGAVPGLTATLAIALLLPFTFHLPPAEALVMLTGIYVGGIYGGAITAITLRIPGAPANALTMLDGHAMAMRGRPEVALGLATISSVLGGLVGGLVLVLCAPQLAAVALRFQSPETCALVLLALVGVTTMTPGTLAASAAATILGLMLSTVGLDRLLPTARLTFGVDALLVGVPLLPVVIGLFAFTEVLWQVGTPAATAPPVQLRRGHGREAWAALREVGWGLVAKSAVIGSLVGALPGAGAAMGASLAYAEAKRGSRHPERFGSGIPEGIVAPEVANNAVTGGAFIPMLAFGIPGDAVTAVMLGGLLIQGITPGPQLFDAGATLVQSIFAGYFLAYGLVLALGFGLLSWYARLGRVDRAVLFPFIAAVSIVAAFASERTIWAMGTTVAVGVAGYLLRRGGIPLVPVLMGLILGPTFEASFRRALILSDGSLSIFLTSPISAGLLGVSVAMSVYYGWWRR